MDNLNDVFKSKYFIFILYNSYVKYIIYGARSSKKVDYFHNKIKEIIETIFIDKNKYIINLEYNIPSYNSLILGFNKNTKFRTFENILKNLI